MYKLKSQLNLTENNCILHVYVTLTSDESIRRTQIENNMTVVPKLEVEKQLNDW